MAVAPLILKNFRIESVAVTYAKTDSPENKTKVFIDKGSILQFEYREGLLNQFLSVTLQIADTTSQLTDVLVGMEKFEIIVTENTHNLKYEFTEDSSNGPLYAYHIHDKQVIDTGKIIVVELCRKDAILSAQERVCKKYTSVAATDLVQDILGNTLQTKKPYSQNVSESVNKLTFIPPMSRPYDVLIWARNKFIGKDQKTSSSGGKFVSAGYLFWETYRSYYFKSIDAIAAQKDVVFTYSTGTGLGGVDEVYRLNNPQFPKAVDMFNDFDRGFFSGTVEFFDTVNCEVVTQKYTLKENYAKWTKIGESSSLPQLYSEVLDDRPTRTMAVSYNDDLFLEPGSEKNTESKMLFKETISQSIQRMGVFSNTIMTARVDGNMAINAGNVLEVEFTAQDGSIDKTYSGRYIIFSLTHLFSKHEDKLNTDLVLVRDSFGV